MTVHDINENCSESRKTDDKEDQEKYPVVFHIDFSWSTFHCEIKPSAYPYEREVVIDSSILFEVQDIYEC